MFRLQHESHGLRAVRVRGTSRASAWESEKANDAAAVTRSRLARCSYGTQHPHLSYAILELKDPFSRHGTQRAPPRLAPA